MSWKFAPKWWQQDHEEMSSAGKKKLLQFRNLYQIISWGKRDSIFRSTRWWEINSPHTLFPEVTGSCSNTGEQIKKKAWGSGMRDQASVTSSRKPWGPRRDPISMPRQQGWVGEPEVPGPNQMEPTGWPEASKNTWGGLKLFVELVQLTNKHTQNQANNRKTCNNNWRENT